MLKKGIIVFFSYSRTTATWAGRGNTSQIPNLFHISVCRIQSWPVGFAYCRLRRWGKAWGFLLQPTVSCDVSRCKKKSLFPINKSLHCSSLLLFYCVNATEFWWARASMLISLEAATRVVVLWISSLSSSFSFPASVTAERMLISFSQFQDRLKKKNYLRGSFSGWMGQIADLEF